MKSEKERLCLAFFQLFDYLKEIGIHNTSASRAINKSPQTISSWKARKTGPKQSHINALLLAFPTQLTEYAQQLGIKVPRAKMIISEDARTAQLLKMAQEQLEQMRKEMAEMKEQGEELERLKKNNDILTRQVERLTEMLAKK